MAPHTDSDRSGVTTLQQIPNIGPAIARDLHQLGIEHPTQLRDSDPYTMYAQLCHQDGKRHDPCVLDVFLAAVDFMQGQPAQPWWTYTEQRKDHLAAHPIDSSAPPTGKAAETNRRSFLRNGTLLLLGTPLLQYSTANAASQEPADSKVRFGVMTDMHYADKPNGGTRYYQQTPTKLARAAQQFKSDAVDFVIELGDFIDSAKSLNKEKEYLRTIQRQYATLPGKKHYVLGNHCVSALTKNEFLAIVGQSSTHYSFDVGAIHFVVLDACFRSDMTPYGRKNFQWTDSNIPPKELQWIENDLRQSKKPTILFVHQRLDTKDHYGIKNASSVRGILERSGNVRAVFQGHYHKNAHQHISGIDYITFAAMVEGPVSEHNAFAVVDVSADGAIQVTGFQDQKSYKLEFSR